MAAYGSKKKFVKNLFFINPDFIFEAKHVMKCLKTNKITILFILLTRKFLAEVYTLAKLIQINQYIPCMGPVGLSVGPSGAT